jgi:RNA polymerase-binding transcription factor DksA
MADRIGVDLSSGPGATDFQDRLDSDHLRLARIVTALEDEGLDREPEAVSVGELASAGQHPADLATETFERERDLGLLSDFRHQLDENERAAARLAGGTYGRCGTCGEQIDSDRLAAVPATRHCKDCQDHFEMEELLALDPEGPLDLQPDDLTEFLPDDDLEPATGPLDPEVAAVHLEGAG